MAPRYPNRKHSHAGRSWNLLTFDRMIAGEIIVLVYWAGLGVIALVGFSVVGAGVGLALREEGFSGWLLGGPVLIGGLLLVAALTLLWRATCEFYIAVFRISEDLRALRREDESAQRPAPPSAGSY